MDRSLSRLCFVIILALSGGVVSASASTFMPLTIEQLAQQSDFVVIARVVDLEAAQPMPNGPIYTFVHLDLQAVVAGNGLDGDRVVLREPGGVFGGVRDYTFGTPQFYVGERCLLFLSRNADQTLQTTQLVLGKFSLRSENGGGFSVVREFDAGTAVLDPQTSRRMVPEPDRLPLNDIVQRVQAVWASAPQSAISTVPAGFDDFSTEYQAPFVLQQPPGRWAQADSGTAVPYYVDATGDAIVGAPASVQAATDALAAWTNIPTAGVVIYNAGNLGTPLPTYAGCGTCAAPNASRILFNDPYDEISSSGCGGFIGLGGYCSCTPTMVVNGTTFNRITEAKVVLQNNLTCVATACNLGELLTHEIGHTIGLGHSLVSDATMRSSAHFDLRCASVRQDDEDGATFIYPTVITPTFTQTATATRTPTFSPSPTAAASVTPTSTPTRSRTPTITPTSFPTPDSGISGHFYYWANAAPLNGVTVNLNGVSADQTTSATGGLYTFAAAASDAAWSVSAASSTSVGSAITAFDAVVVLNAVVGLLTFGNEQFLAMDTNGNHALSAIDAVNILQWRVGLITELPVASASRCNSRWIFTPFPQTVLNQTLTLARPWVLPCQPGAVAFEPLSGAAQNQDFYGVLFGDANGSFLPASGAGGASGAISHSRTHLGAPRRPRHRGLRVPVMIDGEASWQAAELEVHYDTRLLRPRAVRRPAGNPPALLAYNLRESGVIRIAVARLDRYGNPGTAPLMLLFDEISAVPRSAPLRLVWSQVEG